MKNEIVSSQIYKKKKIFIVKEKSFRKKSKTLSSPINRARRHTEPILSKLAELKRQLRLSQENILIQRNVVPPYPPQSLRQRATSIPNSYQQYHSHNQHPYGYGHSGSFDQINTSQNPNNPIYSSYHQQPLQNNQPNMSNTYVNHINHQSSSSSSSTQLTSSSLTSPTQSSAAIYNTANQRNIQQAQQPYVNPSAQAVNGNYKNYPNSSTLPYQNQGPQQNLQQNSQGMVENNQVKGYNNGSSPYVKQINSSTNSMSSSTNAPYSNSSQTDCSNPFYHDKPTSYIPSAPMIQKSNSWMGGDQRYPEQNNIFNEQPPFYQTQSSVPSYGNNGDQYNKYNSHYSHPQREAAQQPYPSTYKNAAFAKGAPYNNSYGTYPYSNAESQQIQNTPSTIASRTSQSPHNGGMIDSFEHGQNLCRSQSENIEQDLQNFFFDSKQNNEQDNDELYNRSMINNNYDKDDIFNNNNCFNDDTDIPNQYTYPYNNGNNFQSSTHGSNNYFQSELNQFADYQ